MTFRQDSLATKISLGDPAGQRGMNFVEQVVVALKTQREPSNERSGRTPASGLDVSLSSFAKSSRWLL
jgi:hypothetical protein